MDKLIESEEEERAESPAETEPQKAERNTSGSNANWPLGIVVALVAAGLIVGLVFLARWIYHVAHHTKTNNPTTSQSQNKGGLSVSSGSGSNNGGSIALPGGNKNNQTGNKSKSSKATTLPNNGPGNVIGVFAAASFAAGALHYIISLRKAAREN